MVSLDRARFHSEQATPFLPLRERLTDQAYLLQVVDMTKTDHAPFLKRR